MTRLPHRVLALAVATALAGPGLAAAASAQGAAGQRTGEAPLAQAGEPPAPPPPPPGGGPGHGFRRPPLDAVLERNAGRLGLDEATRARIRALGDAARPEGDALEEKLQQLRKEMRALLEEDTPDRDAVMRQADAVGAAEVELEKHRLGTMLEIRALLTPEQRRELVKLFEERRREWRRERGDPGRPPPPPPSE